MSNRFCSVSGFQPDWSRESPERGNVTTEFVMVASMMMLFFAVVMQVAFALYTKNMLVDAAVSGARYGTLYDNSTEDAYERTQQLIQQTMPLGYSADISVSSYVSGSTEILEVTVTGPLPLVGPWGAGQTLSGKGQAVIQQ